MKQYSIITGSNTAVKTDSLILVSNNSIVYLTDRATGQTVTHTINYSLKRYNFNKYSIILFINDKKVLDIEYNNFYSMLDTLYSSVKGFIEYRQLYRALTDLLHIDTDKLFNN